MTTIASQITSLTSVYSTVYSDADQRIHQSSASLAFVWGIHRDRWIPRTKGQLRGKCFHLMTSSCIHGQYLTTMEHNKAWPMRTALGIYFVDACVYGCMDACLSNRIKWTFWSKIKIWHGKTCDVDLPYFSYTYMKDVRILSSRLACNALALIELCFSCLYTYISHMKNILLHSCENELLLTCFWLVSTGPMKIYSRSCILAPM